MKVRLLHLADVHLGCKSYFLAEKARERSDDFRHAFRDAVEFALEPRNAIDGVLISGNLFESHRPDQEVWSFAKGLLSRLLAKDIFVAMVPGNHDSYAYKNSVYRTERLPGIDLFLDVEPSKPVVHDVGGTRVFLHGLAYVPGQTPMPLPAFQVSPERGVHIALLNGTPASQAAEHPDRLELDLSGLGEQGFDYIALGGIRSFSERVVGDTTMVYPGSLEGRGFDDEDLGDHGPVVVQFDEAGAHIERLIRNRRTIEHVRIDLRDERISDAESLQDAIRVHSGTDRIVRVTLTGTAEFVTDLEALCGELEDAFFHLEIEDDSRLVDSAMLRKIESENTIRGYFVRKLSARIAEHKARMKKKGDTAELVRQLSVMEEAMKIGVQQFVEEEAPRDSIYGMIPDSDELVDAKDLKDAVGVEDLEAKVKAMLEYRRKLNGTGSSAKSTKEPAEKAAEAAAEGEGA